jgi:hypothetical protein
VLAYQTPEGCSPIVDLSCWMLRRYESIDLATLEVHQSITLGVWRCSVARKPENPETAKWSINLLIRGERIVI